MLLFRGAITLAPLAAASVASQLNSLIIALSFARLAGAGAYGVYQITLAMVAIVAVLAISGAGTAATRAAAQGRTAAWPLFGARLPYCLLGSAVLFAIAGVAAVAGHSVLALAIASGGLTLPLFVGADVFPAQLLGERRFSAYLRFQLLVQTATATVAVAVVTVAPQEPWLAVLGVTGLTGLIQFARLLEFRGIQADAADDLRYARRLTAVSVLATLDARLDILLVGMLLGIREAGLVAVARIFPGFVKNLWTIAYPAIFVSMASGSTRDAARVATRHRFAVMLGFGGLCAVGVVLAPWVVPIFGREFDDAVPVTQLMLLGAGCSAAMFLDHTLLRARGYLREEAIVYAALTVFSLVALPPLIFMFGVAGVGVESILAAGVYVALIMTLRRRVEAVPA